MITTTDHEASCLVTHMHASISECTMDDSPEAAVSMNGSPEVTLTLKSKRVGEDQSSLDSWNDTLRSTKFKMPLPTAR